ncbi:hypothetical protein OSB04_008316 [Centaurea solstitialis]|uniref:SBP-type domain-containing protein n=1 Tax=Centaurea solstitialis TaxID=347529 RepID=A0AA38TX27_9ASTR|nr:hypothetical protein OSB04_008316 [Centaurea solstitialis]
MLDYEWGNPLLSGAAVAVSVDEAAAAASHQADHHRHHNNNNIFDHYSQAFNEPTNHHQNSPYLHNPNDYLHNPTHQHQHHYLNNNNPTHFAPLYDPRAYAGECGGYSQHSLSLEPDGTGQTGAGSTGGYVLMPKSEPSGCAIDFTNNRIGLNLGGRTYFSSAEDDFVNRLYRRSRPLEAALVTSPRCQAEGCNADLTHAKHYHRRHKVCEFHSKASTVITAGLTQRFCQQCSRFHLLSEFDNGKRSCRKRLADHNRRRRKSSQNQDHSKSQSSSSDIMSRYQSDSRG